MPATSWSLAAVVPRPSMKLRSILRMSNGTNARSLPVRQRDVREVACEWLRGEDEHGAEPCREPAEPAE
jgi:hypothetical protein